MDHETFYAVSAQVLPILGLALVIEIRRPGGEGRNPAWRRAVAAFNLLGLTVGTIGLFGAVAALVTGKDPLGLQWLVGVALAFTAWSLLHELARRQAIIIGVATHESDEAADKLAARVYYATVAVVTAGICVIIWLVT